MWCCAYFSSYCGQSVAFFCPTTTSLLSVRVLDRYDHVGPFQEVAIILIDHRSHCFLQKVDVLFLMIIICMLAVAAGISEMGPKGELSKPCKHTKQLIDYTLSTASNYG